MNKFTLDIAAGKSRDELAADYKRASRNASKWQRIAMFLANAAPESVSKLPPEYRKIMEDLIEAYKDPPDDEPGSITIV